MEALDKIFDFKLNSNMEDYILETLQEYKLYLSLIDKLDPMLRKGFFRTIKNQEIINNHEMEHENAFLIQMEMNAYPNKQARTSIDVISNLVLNDKEMNLKDFEKIHRLLIRGTTDDIEKNYPIRTTDTSVCEVKNRVLITQYIPPSPDQIRPYLLKLFDFMNNLDDCNEKDVFYKSILEHFYIAALQPFGNGNTRMARLVEYSEIFKLTRKILGFDLEQPALFMSKNYFITRPTYRDSIARLVNEPTDENFNKWVNYNLNTVNDQMYFHKNNLEKRIG